MGAGHEHRFREGGAQIAREPPAHFPALTRRLCAHRIVPSHPNSQFSSLQFSCLFFFSAASKESMDAQDHRNRFWASAIGKPNGGFDLRLFYRDIGRAMIDDLVLTLQGLLYL